MRISVHHDCLVRHASPDIPNDLEETISRKRIAAIVVETSTADAAPRLLHWFVQHDRGWTLHFNSDASGVDEAMAWFRSFPDFDWKGLDQARLFPDRKDFQLWHRGITSG